jgi:hypothetical protein
MSSGDTVFRRFHAHILGQKAVILTEMFCDFCQLLQADTRRVPYTRL